MKKFLSLFVVSIFLLSLWSFNTNKKRIIIDAGHGGTDTGSTKEEIKEKEITLAVAELIKSENKNSNIEIVLIRDSDSFPSLAQRVDFINTRNADLVISLHVNFNGKDSRKKGTEIYYQNSETSLVAAKKLSQYFSNPTLNQQNFKILRESKATALLVELGFLSNDEDRKYLSSKSGQKEIANKILDFVNEY